jgi:hypothetical protein
MTEEVIMGILFFLPLLGGLIWLSSGVRLSDAAEEYPTAATPHPFV